MRRHAEMAAPTADDVVTVWMTAPDLDVAESLSRTLVEERLAACANLLPGVVSVYRWEGAMQREAEVMMVLKTTGGRAQELARRAAELHPYEVPEVLTLPVVGGSDRYRAWVAEEVA